MEELKEELYKLIKEVDGICRKYNITYYAEGGSAIGAIRHRKIIPWDDDMDIVMTRDNFNKFMDAFKKENPKDRVLECSEFNDKWPLVTIKYMNTENAAIFKSLFLDDYAGGLFIDIFILDPIPRGKEKWFKREFLSYCEILNPIYVVNDGESRTCRYKWDLLKSKIIGRDKVLESYRKKLFTYSDKDCDEYMIRWGIAYQHVPKIFYQEPRYYDFAGKLKIPVAKCAERILSGYFGEGWFFLPDVGEQENHDLVRSLSRAYSEYKDDYMQFVNKESIKKSFLKSKILRMNTLKGMRKYEKNYEDLLFSHDLLLINKINFKEVISAYNNKNYKLACELSSNYMNLQTKGLYRRKKMFFDVDYDFINAVLFSYIYIGQYYKSVDLYRIVSTRYEFKEVNKLLDDILDLRDLYYQEKYKDALSLVNKLLENDSNNCSLFKIKMDIIVKGKLKDNEIREYLRDLNILFDKTEDVELYKYMGDLYKMLNDKDKSSKYYDLFKANSRNGLLLLEIEE